MRFAASILLCLNAFAAGSAKLTYTRSFPGSTPPFFKITIDQAGLLEYTEAPSDPPLQAKLDSVETTELFDAADRLGHFKTPLESGLKVANTGKKTFRFEDAAGEVTETIFNYSLDVTAQHLLDKMEQIASSERAYLDLDRTVHFDKLGVNDALAEIEALWLRKQLAAPQQFVPLLTRVATHDSFMHLARDRAARLKDEFTRPETVAPSEPVKNEQH